MYSVASDAAVRCLALPRHAPLARHLSQLVTDVAGELGAIHPGAPRCERIERLKTLGYRYDQALTDWRKTLRWEPAADPERACLLAREMQLVAALQDVLWHAPKVLDQYEPQQSGNEIPRMCTPVVLQQQGESQSTVEWLLQQGAMGRRVAAAYTSSLEPGLRPAYASAALDDKLLGPMIEHLSRGGAETGLSEAQVLALRLYAHDTSPAFNLMRGCDYLRQLLPGDPVTRGFDEVVDLIHKATQALYDVGPQARVWGNLFKGMQAPHGAAWQVGQEIALTRPYSVTTLKRESYEGREVYGEPYDHALWLQGSPSLGMKAVLIAAFHTVRTAGQGEALVLPRQLIQIVAIQQREVPNMRTGGKMPVTWYHAVWRGNLPPDDADARR